MEPAVKTPAGRAWPNDPGALLIVLALAFLIRLPFLHQAIQGDDVIYLAAAQHAQIDPLHPNHLKYVYQGDTVDLRGHSHGPLNGWILGLLLAAAGDIREFAFHAAYLVFTFIALYAMWMLAERFSPHPVWACLLFLAVPSFVINGTSLEADIPFLAFWMAAIALFVAGSLGWACLPMALAALTAYQGVFLTPILMAYVWIYRRKDRTAWLATLAPLAALLAWQLFERLSTGALPAGVLAGYFQSYNFQALQNKLSNALALTIHACWLVFPLLLVPAVRRAWGKRDRDTLFLAAWIGIFFAGALGVFYAGSARYLLPMAPAVVLLVSRVRRDWLAVGFAVQIVLSLALAWVNYQHWAGYRDFAASVRPYTVNRRVWINDEWGLRYYLEADGGLPLREGQMLRPGDVVVTSELSRPVEFNDPVTPLAKREIRATLPLRLIGLESHSGYSTLTKGFWPFGISTGPIDRVRADLVMERIPTLEYLPMTASGQMVAGIYALEGTWRWMSRRGVVLLKSPAAAKPLRVEFTIPGPSPARRLTLLVDGAEVAAQSYPGPGSYTLISPPLKPAGTGATVTVVADQVFSVPGDRRELSIILTGIGFR